MHMIMMIGQMGWGEIIEEAVKVYIKGCPNIDIMYCE